MPEPLQPGDIVEETCGGRHARRGRVAEVEGASIRLVDLVTGQAAWDDAGWYRLVVRPIRMR